MLAVNVLSSFAVGLLARPEGGRAGDVLEIPQDMASAEIRGQPYPRRHPQPRGGLPADRRGRQPDPSSVVLPAARLKDGPYRLIGVTEVTDPVPAAAPALVLITHRKQALYPPRLSSKTPICSLRSSESSSNF